MNEPEVQKTRQWEVVVAEDNDDHALLIQMALERAVAGTVSVRRARNGDEAVGLVREARPDLLLLDLKMPGRAGHEVLEEIKSDPDLKKVPIAVLTSSDRDDDIARSYGLGGNHFITKPESPAELEQRLRTLLRNIGELSDIRRGTSGLRTTAVSAVDPDAVLMRRVRLVGMTLLVALLLWVFAVLSGAF